MTYTWLGEAAEKQGYYLNPDNKGEYVRDMKFPWKEVPMGLQTEVPIPEAVQGRRRNVLFCHVPGGVDEASIELSRDALLAVIGAAIHGMNEVERNGGSEPFKVAFAKLTG